MKLVLGARTLRLMIAGPTLVTVIGLAIRSLGGLRARQEEKDQEATNTHHRDGAAGAIPILIGRTIATDVRSARNEDAGRIGVHREILRAHVRRVMLREPGLRIRSGPRAEIDSLGKEGPRNMAQAGVNQNIDEEIIKGGNGNYGSQDVSIDLHENCRCYLYLF